jgi:hypothetical protein
MQKGRTAEEQQAFPDSNLSFCRKPTNGAIATDRADNGLKACDKHSPVQPLAGALLCTVLPHCSYILTGDQSVDCGLGT